MRGSEFGALLCRHLTPQRKTAIWVHNDSPSGAQQPKDIWENLLPHWLLVRTNLFVPSRFGLPVRNLTIAVSAI